MITYLHLYCLVVSKENNKRLPQTKGSNLFEPETIMKFQEMPLNIAIKKLKEYGISVSEEEASEILDFAHNLAKIIIKEFILSNDRLY